MRGALDRGIKTETPKVLGDGQENAGLDERRKLPRGVWGGTPVRNDFSAFKWPICRLFKATFYSV